MRTPEPLPLSWTARAAASAPLLPSPLVSIHRREGLRDQTPVKHASTTRRLPSRPTTWGGVRQRLLPPTRAPRVNDVLVGRVLEIRQHTRVETDTGRHATLFPGDVVVGAFGNRYATKAYEGRVPNAASGVYHLLTTGGVLGHVVSAAEGMLEPTLIEPLGYLAAEGGGVENLGRHALRPLPEAPRVPTIVVVGSSMDAGKTTMLATLCYGLAAAGRRVHAGKLTGTGCLKDLHRYLDGGAAEVLDFCDAGFAATSLATPAELGEISEALITNLAAGRPDYIALEIADGLVQRETRIVLSILAGRRQVDHVLVAVHDALSIPTCIDLLERQWSLQVTAISGLVTRSPLSTAEARGLTALPCLTQYELAEPEVEALFQRRQEERLEKAQAL